MSITMCIGSLHMTSIKHANEAAAILVFHLIQIDTLIMATSVKNKVSSDEKSEDNSPRISDCVKKLEHHVHKRYLEKISVIGIDPILIPENSLDPECLPPVEAADLLSYLVLDTSYYTKNQSEAFRSLKAYNQMVSGFIVSIQGHIVAKKFVVCAKVRHSRRINDPSVPLWILTEKDGTIICAHCTGCMAGLGECCLHIASVLFYLEAWTRLNGKLACTQVKCTWILPTYVKEVSYAPVSDIDFTSAKKLKDNLDKTIEKIAEDHKQKFESVVNITDEQIASTPKPSKQIPFPSDVEIKEFYARLSGCKTKPVALSLVQPYSEHFVLKSRDLPTITDLYDPKYLDFEYHDLIKACSQVTLEIADIDIKLIAKVTQSQSKGNSFFNHRARRIGASMSKLASHTNPALPSQSLVKSICYPHVFKLSTAATEYGCKHEKEAILEFENNMKVLHKNFRTIKCGMFINKEYPWLDATPDFLSWCQCCGYGCGEVKCPYCIEGTDFKGYLLKSSSYLEKVDGKMRLKKDHQYYYQVQQQIFTVKMDFCDFVVCAFDDKAAKLAHDRIYPDNEHWNNVVSKLSQFWKYCILPEILGRWYTRKSKLLKPSEDTKAIYYCRMDTGEEVVKC